MSGISPQQQSDSPSVPHSGPPDLRPHTLWITWEQHRRSRELSRYLGVELIEVIREAPRYLRHPWAAWQTVRVLRQEEPDAIVVQNPSVFLALVAVLAKPLFGYRMLLDAHNAAIRPEGLMAPLSRRLQGWIQRRVDATIVSNSGLAEDVLSNGGHPFVLPDRLPTPPTGLANEEPRDGRAILLICTFGEDEPVQEFMEAIGSLANEATVFVTGPQSSIPPPYRATAPRRVVFTGWLPDLEYWRLLASVDVVVDLTTREDCLVCGAYEAVAVGQPLVLSDTAALRSYFRRGVVFTKNEPETIASALSDAMARSDELRAEMVGFRATLADEWSQLGEQFAALLGCKPVKNGEVADAGRNQGAPGQTSSEE